MGWPSCPRDALRADLGAALGDVAQAEAEVVLGDLAPVGGVGRVHLHGYAIIRRTGELSGGRVRLSTGTLYTALDRLTAEGNVELVREEIVNGRLRRSYGLTPPGAGALRTEAAQMAEAARLVTDRGRDLKAGGPVWKASPA